MVKGKGKFRNILRVERIDDVPLLIKQMQKMEIGKTIEENIPIHGNWSGLSMGKVVEIWLSYILSEGDHRLNKLEDWAVNRLYSLRALYEDESISRTDFTDDKLEVILDYLSDQAKWNNLEQILNGRILRLYRIVKDKDGIIQLRLDATIGKAHKQVKTEGLFQFGASKHFNPNLPQFKTMLSTLDTVINGFAYPVSSITVPGNTSDDVLYIPLIEQSKASLEYEGSLLIVGDKKLGSKNNRAYIENSDDYYLSPLSDVQISREQVAQLVQQAEQKSEGIQAIKIEKQEVGKGFEYKVEQEVILEKDGETKTIQWTERRLVVRSEAHAKAKTAALNRRIAKAKADLDALSVRKQGRQTPKTRKELNQAIQAILEKYQVVDFIKVSIHQKTTSKTIRAYGGKAARKEKTITFKLEIALQEHQIQTHLANAAWCVFATNAPKQQMDLTDAVQMYREQFQIEDRFNDLKNKVTQLIPIFLQKDNRIRSLINLMMVGLKIICIMEVKVAQTLKQTGEKLSGLFSGNPKRSTEKPTAKSMLTRFREISFSLFILNNVPQSIAMTPLDNTQIKILALLGFDHNIYEHLFDKMNSIFLPQFKRT